MLRMAPAPDPHTLSGGEVLPGLTIPLADLFRPYGKGASPLFYGQIRAGIGAPEPFVPGGPEPQAFAARTR
jgi:hypothetical protein